MVLTISFLWGYRASLRASLRPVIFLLLVFAITSVTAQNFVSNGGFNAFNGAKPVYLSDEYSYGQFIITASELSAYGMVAGSSISTFTIYMASNPSTSLSTGYNTFDLYGGLTSKSEFNSYNDWVTADLVLLYSGQGTPGSSVSIWSDFYGTNNTVYPLDFSLNQPLSWDGISNMVFSMDESVAGKASNWVLFVITNTASNSTNFRELAKHSPSNDIIPTSPGTADYLDKYIPAIELSYTNPKTWNGSSWSSGAPTSSDNVLVSSNLSLSTNLECANLYVRNSSQITVQPGKSLVVEDLNLASGTSLTFQANSSAYSMLKASGSITNSGTITCEQYIPSLGHHGISSPMTAGFTTTSGTSSALYGYNSSTGVWNMSPTMTSVGAGFFAPVQASNGFQSAAGSFSVTGTPNTSHTHTLGYSTSVAAGGSGAGWNLIGNPYTCGLDWTSVTKNNVNNAYYVWDASSGTYQYYSGSALSGTYLASSSILPTVIPLMQAFWVQVATNASASIVSTMANHGTVASTPTFYKTSPDNLILYAEDLSDQSLSDAMWITHASGYTNDFEGDRDAWKRSNYGGQANIYSYHNGEKMAINAIDLSSSPSIPVGVKAPANGKKYKLVLEQIVNNQDYQVILEDKLFNSFTDISNQGYSFTSGLWQNEDPRFVLHISQSTVGIGEESLQSVKLYQQGDRLILQGNAQEHGRYSLITLDGRQVAEGVLQAGMANIQAPNPGVYIVQLSGVAPVAQRVLVY